MQTKLYSSWFVLVFIYLTSVTAVSQTPQQFVAVTPCRLVDTRNPSGEFGGPSLQAKATRSFSIPDNTTCNIPSTATAYSLNVTVVPQGRLDYLTAWPMGQNQPVVSTLNSYDGRVKANAAIVPAGVQGAISFYVTDVADLVLDIDGYFAPASSSTLAFFPLTPCRVADTRWSNGPLGGPSMSAQSARYFPVKSSSCTIPSSARGYSMNFTVVPKGGKPLNYLTVWPADQPQPWVSTLNAPTGTVTANAAVVPGAANNGDIKVFVTDDTDLIIDIDGYFAPSNSGLDALSLYVLNPCRVLDTRLGAGSFSGTIPVNVLTSPCAVPSAEAYVLNATAVPKGPLGYLTLWPDEEGQPYVSTLNAADGTVTSNMAIVPTLNGNIDAFTYNPTNLIVDIFSYFAPITSLVFTTTSLPSATVNYNYSTALAATGGVTPYTWSITLGSLPPGLILNANSGVISGMPTTSGDFPFTAQVKDSQSPAAIATAPLGIGVNATITQLTIVTASLPTGNQNVTYSAMLAATGGITPYSWSLTAGNLPGGLTLNGSTGAITGTPTGAGTANFTVKATDSQAQPATASAQLSITIQPAVPLSVTTSSLPTGNAGTPYSAMLAAVGGLTPYTWSVTTGQLPSGLSLNSSTGAIAGTPTVVGTSNFTVQVADSEAPQVKATAPLSVIVNPGGGGGDPGVLTGNYAFLLNGFNSAGQWTLAGSFISDGMGNITSGVVDGNSVTGQPFNTPITGVYSITTGGLNTITIQGQSFGPKTFAFVLSSSGNGRIIEYDDTTGQGSRGAGVLRKADSSAFTLSKLNGGWVFGMTGADDFGHHMADVGVFTLTSGTFNNGVCDMNDGQFETCTFYGALSATDTTTGRGVSTVQSNNGTSHQAVYVVSGSELVMEQIDSVPSTKTPLLVGSVLKQSGSFNNGSLNGTAVSYMQAIHGGDGLDQSVAAIFSFAGNGNFNLVAMDEDLAGTITQDQPSQGTYSVQSNGAFDFGTGNPAGFLIGQNRAFFVGRGNSSLFGTLEPQTGGPFSNASIAGTYAAGQLVPLDYANAHNEVDVAPANGLGTLTLSGDSSSSQGIDQWFGTIVSYSVASNGRGTGEAQGDNTPGVIYVISPTKFVVLMPSPDAAMSVFEH